ncbi:MAG: TatD family hydrolase [Micromonosporaceae bacterium]
MLGPMRTKKTDRTGEPPPPPEPLAVPVLDSHTHFDLQDGCDTAAGVADALAKARAVGVDRVVQVGIDVPSSRWAADLADQLPGVVATVALHPNDAPHQPDLDAALAEIDALAARDRVRGVGETGLDYFRTDEAGRERQHRSFRAHIDIAKRHGKALVIHDRDAHQDVLRILEEEGAPDQVVLHCFSGDAEFAKQCADRGYVCSFAGTVTFKNAQPLREAARTLPAELILVETDAPFLTPMPYRGRPNAPYLTPLTVRFLAELRGEELDELCGVISATGDRVFGPW